MEREGGRKKRKGREGRKGEQTFFLAGELLIIDVDTSLSGGSMLPKSKLCKE